MDGRYYVKLPLRSSATLGIKHDDKYCFLWSTPACLHLCKNYHPNRVWNYRQTFTEVSIEGFDFRNGFQCSDVQKFEKPNNLSINIFELNFYKDQNKWKHKSVPIEKNKFVSDRNVDFLKHRNHHTLNKKLNVFLEDHNKKFVCLNSYTSENMLMIHKPICENIDICSIRSSSDSHLHWKGHFHKLWLYFRRYADF